MPKGVYHTNFHTVKRKLVKEYDCDSGEWSYAYAPSKGRQDNTLKNWRKRYNAIKQ